jgi:hypothetical protein
MAPGFGFVGVASERKAYSMYFEFARRGHGVKEQARTGTDFGIVVLVSASKEI